MSNLRTRATETPLASLNARQDFARRLEDGNYRELFGTNLIAIFTQAVERLAEVGLAEEIGSLRFVLARLLAEENDLNRLATNTARIVSVAVRSAQTHHDISGNNMVEILEALTKVLDEIDQEIQPANT